MGINTLSKKNIFFLFFCWAFTFSLSGLYAQCPTVTNQNQSFCDNPYPTIASLMATDNGGGIVWYETAVSTTPLSNSIALIDGEDYFVSDISGSCTVRQRVVASVVSAPVVQPRTQGFCEESTISDLQAVGNMVQWYAALSGGSPLNPNTIITDNTLYYASQINPITGCETSRRSVLALVRILPAPTGSTLQRFCSQPAPTVSNLTANGNNIRWYLSPSSGVELNPTTPLIDGQTYYAATSDDLCESLTRLGVLVEFTEPNNAGTNGQRSFCTADVAITPPFNLFSFLGGTPNINGTWSGPLSTANGHLGTVNISTLTAAGSPYVFTYTVAAGVCPTVRATVTINILPLPFAIVSAVNPNLCSGESTEIVITGTPNSIVTYTQNGTIFTVPLGPSGTANVPGTYTTTTDIRLTNVTTTGNPSCSRALDETVRINVTPLPTAAISITKSQICSGESTQVNFTGTPGAIVTYTVNGTQQTITLSAAGTASINVSPTVTTNYVIVSVRIVGPPACSQFINGQNVQVVVIPPPTATISVTSPDVCLGTNAVVTITGTANATVIYTINGATHTAVLNGSGIYIVPAAAYTVNTTFTLVSITTAAPTSCTRQLTGQQVVLTIRTLPTASIAINADTICIGGTATVTITGTPNATVVYTQNGTSFTVNLNAAGIYVLPAATYNVQTEFVLVSVTSTVAPFCSQIINQRVVLDVDPLPTANIAVSESPICSGDNATITITGTPGAIVTYTENGTTNTITINSQGFATIDRAFTVTTIFTLVNLRTPGNPGCIQQINGQSVTVTVIPLLTATLTATATTICSGDAVTVTITGTPNASVTYTENGTSNTVTLNENGIYTINGNYTTETTFVLVGIRTTEIPFCEQPLNQTLIISILPQPTAGISIEPTEICEGETALVTFTGTANATVTYAVNGTTRTIRLNDLGIATTEESYSVTTEFELISVATVGSPGCSQDLNVLVNLDVIPLPTANISINPATICSGGNASVVITGTPNALVTYTQNGTTQTTTIAPDGTVAVPGIFTEEVNFVLVSVSTTTNPACIRILNIPATLTVIPLPTATISSVVETICSGSNIRLTISGTPNAIVTYTQNGTVHTLTLDAFGNGYIDGSFTETTTFILTNIRTAAPNSCSQTLSERRIITVTQPPIAGNSTAVEVCGSSNPIDLFSLLGTAAQTGGIWTPRLASGTGIFNPTVDPAGQYQYLVLGTAPCPNATAIVAVTIKAPANAGSDAAPNVCSNQDPVDLFGFLGPNAQTGGVWTPALPSGSGIFNPAIDAAGVYTYTVAGTFPCLNDQATVTISITPGPDAGLPGTAAFCVNSAPADLFLSLNGTPQTGGTWSPPLASGSGIFNPAVDVAGIYTYTFAGNQPCDDDTATVTVTINPIPDAGENGVAPQMCSNFPSVDLFTFLNGTPQTGGVWTPTLASGTGLFNPAVDAPGNYTYTVGSALCERDSATVAVNVTRSPNAGGLNAPLLINACITNNAVDLFTGLNGTQDVGTWTNNTTGVVVSNIFDATIGAGTYLFRYTVTGGVSPCESDFAIVTVIVAPIPNAGTYVGAPQNFCNAIGTINLFSLLTGNQTGGDWIGSNGLVVNNIVDISSMIPGEYSYTYTIANTCGSDSEPVRFTIQPNPVLALANISVSNPFCLGTNAVVNLSGMVDGNYILTYNLSGSNVLSNETINLTISGSTGSFAINAIDLPNLGTTTITFVNIANIGTTCVTNLTDIKVDFIVRPVSNLDAANVSISNICLGSDAVVTISNATGLVDGNYQFGISMPQANPTTATTGAVTITGGNGSFVLPSTFFANTGTYNFTITTITSLSSGCNNAAANATTTFQVFPIPNISGATAIAIASCVNVANQVTISNATALADGVYNINYQLAGANTTASTATVTMVSGTGSFMIPADQLTSPGSVVLTITQLTGATGLCGAAGTAFNPVLFTVSQAGTPVLIDKGNEFCAKDNPTVANLSNNISGTETVIWYDAETNGTAYNDSDLLVNGGIYFASFGGNSSCESAQRLRVVVDLTKCDDILIPDGFSPNNDGINDQFVINELAELYPNFKLEIYNRYGSILYKGNKNTPHWDGTTTEGGLKMGNQILPAGVYFYVLEFNDGVKKPKQGRVYLSR